MNNQDAWHSQDAFWEVVEPVLFNDKRLSNAREEVDKIVKLLGLEGGARILDLPCGVGRHCLEFSRRDFDVTGVDRTKSYIERARSQAEVHKLNAVFVQGDMREYCVPEGFDVILNLFGSFGYFEDPDDDRKVVANMYASLRAGGQFLIETAGKEILARDFQSRDWSEAGGVLLLSERKVSHDWGRIDSHWIAIKGTHRVEHHVSVRLYSAVELSSLLVDCGFYKVQVYGSLDGIDYNQDAQRLVVVGVK